MKFTKKHLTIVLMSALLLVLSVVGISYMEDSLVYRSTDLETKNEARLINTLRNLQYEKLEREMIYIDTIRGGESTEGYTLYFANNANYKEIYGKYGLKNIEKIKIDQGYQSRYPLEHEKLQNYFPAFKNTYPATLIAIADGDEIRSYFYVDGRIADFSNVEKASPGNLSGVLGEDQRVVIKSDSFMGN